MPVYCLERRKRVRGKGKSSLVLMRLLLPQFPWWEQVVIIRMEDLGGGGQSGGLWGRILITGQKHASAARPLNIPVDLLWIYWDPWARKWVCKSWEKLIYSIWGEIRWQGLQGGCGDNGQCKVWWESWSSLFMGKVVPVFLWLIGVMELLNSANMNHKVNHRNQHKQKTMNV